jgi:transposase
MPFNSETVAITAEERDELEQMTRSRTLSAADIFRARLILKLAEGLLYRTIQTRLDTTAVTISRWKKRFMKGRIAGLLEVRHPGKRPIVITPALTAKVIKATRGQPKDGSTHWSRRKLARSLGISKDSVQRIWQKAELRPHRLERYMMSDDPDFERKASDIIGLYLDPLQHAAVQAPSHGNTLTLNVASPYANEFTATGH